MIGPRRAAERLDFVRFRVGLVATSIALLVGCGRSPAPEAEKPKVAPPVAPAAAPAPKEDATRRDPALRKFASRFMAFYEELTSGIKLLTKNRDPDTWRRKSEVIDDLESRIPPPPPEYEELFGQCAEAWKVLRWKVSYASEQRAKEERPDSIFAEMTEATAIGKARSAALAILEPLSASPQFVELESISEGENR